jgi:2,3-bisphosphoglycerate-independent phosphoglycerate mutase
VQYRHLMVLRDAGELDCTCTPPHDIPDQPVAKYQPVGTAAGKVVALMDRARTLLANHPINTARLAANKQPATDIWLWGQGRVKPLETWQERFGLRGASIAAVDLIRGITKLLGCAQIDVPGATGFLDTNYAGKGAAAVQALDDYDVVCVHVEAPDEAGHLGDMSAKIEAIEQVDRHVVGPVLTKLRTFDKWRILIAPDHPTPVSTRTHTSTPPPFCAAGTGINASNASGFSEKVAEADGQPVHPGHELITKFVSAAIM